MLTRFRQGGLKQTAVGLSALALAALLLVSISHLSASLPTITPDTEEFDWPFGTLIICTSEGAVLQSTNGGAGPSGTGHPSPAGQCSHCLSFCEGLMSFAVLTLAYLGLIFGHLVILSPKRAAIGSEPSGLAAGNRSPPLHFI